MRTAAAIAAVLATAGTSVGGGASIVFPDIGSPFLTGSGGFFVKNLSGDGQRFAFDRIFFDGEQTNELTTWSLSEGAITISSEVTSPSGIDGDGSHVVGNGWIVTPSETLLFPGVQFTDMTPDGSIAAGFTEDFVATLWREGEGLTQIDDPELQSRRPDIRGVSDDGETIVGSIQEAAGGPQEAYLWNPVDGLVRLNTLAAAIRFSAAFDVSADGSRAVGRVEVEQPEGPEVSFPFIWSAGTGMLLIDPAEGASQVDVARFVSADGQLVAGGDAPPFGGVPFVWTAQRGTRSLQSVLENEFGLDTDGALDSQTRLVGMSDDGTTFVTYSSSVRRFAYITIPRDCPGDADFNGVTEVADITMVVKNLGSGAPNTWGNPGDANGDGVVTVQDVNYVVSNLGCVRQ